MTNLLLLLSSCLARSVVSLSLDQLTEQQDNHHIQDPAQLISIAEHLQREHLGISNFNPSVRLDQRNSPSLYSTGSTFSGSASIFSEDSSQECPPETF